jgi:hypothetical protein
MPSIESDDEYEEIGRPEGPFEERHVDPYESATTEEPSPATERTGGVETGAGPPPESVPGRAGSGDRTEEGEPGRTLYGRKTKRGA